MKIITYLLLSLLLASCARLPTAPRQTWPQRQQQLSQLQQWQSKGTFSLRGIPKPVSANFIWQQQDRKRLQARFFGPFGSGQIRLNVTNKYAQLKTADSTVRARSAASLLYSQLGWHLPVEDLYFWLRGLPDPSHASQQQLDPQQRLKTLKQSKWTLRYSRYQQVNGLELPTRIEATYKEVKLKIVIREWQFNTSFT